MCLAIALDIVPSSTCKGFGSDGRIWNVGLCPMSVATTSDLSIVSSTDPREDRMDIPCTSPRVFKTAGGSITRLCACAIPSSWVWSAMDFPLASRCPSHPPLPSMSSCVFCCWRPSPVRFPSIPCPCIEILWQDLDAKGRFGPRPASSGFESHSSLLFPTTRRRWPRQLHTSSAQQCRAHMRSEGRRGMRRRVPRPWSS